MAYLAEQKEEKEKDLAGEEFDPRHLYIWLKGIEGKLNTFRREFALFKEDTAKKYVQLAKEIKTINDDLLELKRENEKTREKIELIIKELKLTAGKEEVLTLKKYLELWNPLNFVSQRDVERLVEEKLRENSPTETKKT